VFGQNYPTPDGTCIRDYIHVADLADAHIKALEYLRKDGKSDFINLGTGHGYSVLEVIQAAEEVTGNKIKMRMDPPRPGDPARLVADAKKAKQVLGWKPKYDMAGILRSQWEWRKTHPKGYAKD
jgi:UDP-glucose 4-epimerase